MCFEMRTIDERVMEKYGAPDRKGLRARRFRTGQIFSKEFFLFVENPWLACVVIRNHDVIFRKN